MLLVFDIRPADLEPVDLGCERRGDHRPVAVAALRQFPRRARRVGGDDGAQPELGNHVAALPERMHMARHRLEFVEPRAGHPEQLMMDPEEVLADDMEMRCRHQMVDVGDPPGNRVFDRDHREMRRPGRHGRKRVLERAARQRLVIGKRLLAGDVRIGPRLPLKSDLQWLRHATVSLARSAGRSRRGKMDPRPYKYCSTVQKELVSAATCGRDLRENAVGCLLLSRVGECSDLTASS